ncbi:MAG: Rrf2 family transcriptional regulator [Kiritimatiellae bacterium]|nr:Rrf2 family transcriptional regulator [Kiritimatiellia bacterium]
MRVSTKGRYGLRVLLDIALHQRDRPVALRDIAERQDISQKYIWQVVSPLKAAGLLNTVRGAQGGCLLARDPDQITMLEVVEILEGPVALLDCLKDEALCRRSSACSTQMAWRKVTKAMRKAMGEVTLKKLMRWQNECEENSSSSYVI